MTNKFDKKLLLTLLASFLIAAFSFLIIFKLYSSAFPEFAIDFKVSKEEVNTKAKAFLKERGVDTKKYKDITIFSDNQLAKTYLDQELGNQETAKIAPITGVWQWRTRFYRELEKEEYEVGHRVDGQLAAFSHLIPEEKEGERLERKEAQIIAENFLKNQGIFLNNISLIGEETIDQPNRLDHNFVWENGGISSGEAKARISIIVQGDEIGSYENFLKIPEAWQRDYESRHSQNNTAQLVASVLFFILAAFAFITLVRSYKDKIITFRPLIPWIVVGFLASFLAGLNEFPLTFYGYSTTSSFSSFIGLILISLVIGALFSSLLIGLFLIAGTIQNDSWKGKIYNPLTIPKNLWTRQTFEGLVVGTTAGLAIVAFVVFYYLAGRQFGFWVPAEIPYSDIFSTYIPWIYALLVGFAAATTEEFLFRLFGIPFLAKLTKSLPLAVILTSVVWGFGHSGYPQEPWFARGIEVSIIGVGQAFIFLRFGILAPLISHYVGNAFQTTLFLYNSNNPYIQVSSIIVSFAPAILALGIGIFYLLKGKFEPFKDTAFETLKKASNLVKSKSSKKLEETKSVINLPGKKSFAILLTLSIISVSSLFILKTEGYGDFSKYEVSRQEAQKIADEYLSGKNINTNIFQKSVKQRTDVDPLLAPYALEEMKLDQLNEVHKKSLPGNGYSIRFFKYGEKEEYEVFVIGDGKIEWADHIVDEKAPGPIIAESGARKIAENFVTSEKELDLANLNFLESNRVERENRIDYSFSWEDRDIKVRDLNLRYSVNVIAGQPWGFQRFFKLPEEFIRSRIEMNIRKIVPIATTIVFLLSTAIASFVYLLNLTRRQEIKWKTGLKIGITLTIISLVSQINGAPTFLFNYPTEWSFEIFLATRVLSTIATLTAVCLASTLVISFALAAWRDNVSQVLPAKPTKSFWGKTILISTLFVIIQYAITKVSNFILVKSNLLKDASFSNIPGIDTVFPSIDVLTSSSLFLLIFPLLAGLLLTLKHYLKRWLYVLGVIALFALPLTLSANTNSELVVGIAEGLLLFITSYLAIIFWLKNNATAYIASLFIAATFQGFLGLSSQPESFIKINGIFGLIVLSTIFFFSIYYSTRSRTN